jgi:hypothetical protein
MAGVDDVIAIGNFRLDAFEKLMRLQIDIAKAQIDIADKLQDVIKKQIENEERAFRLKELKNAKKRFLLMLRDAKRQVTTCQTKLSAIGLVQPKVAALALGELIVATNVGRSWSGLQQAFTLAQQVGVSPTVVKVKAEDRRGKYFVLPSNKDFECETAPSDITDALVLFVDWCNSQHYVPKRGTPPYEKLMELITTINNSLADLASTQEDELADALEKFEELSKEKWQKVDPVAEANALPAADND